jgi:hypothetical protein
MFLFLTKLWRHFTKVDDDVHGLLEWPELNGSEAQKDSAALTAAEKEPLQCLQMVGLCNNYYRLSVAYRFVLLKLNYGSRLSFQRLRHVLPP